MQAIWDAPVVSYPFPHFYAKNVFTQDFYAEILKRLPKDGAMMRYSAYPERMDARENMDDLVSMFDIAFMKMLLDKFGVTGTNTDLRFVRDRKGYCIPPHTDKVSKVISLLFYLPADDSLKEYGTGIFVPNEKGFSCKEGKHHSFTEFTEVWRAPFMPNTCFGFVRNDISFHGVKPIGDVVRNTLLYNINK